MDKTFTNKDAKRLISEHRKIQAGLESGQNSVAVYKKEIENAADAFVAEEVLEKLRGIPIEEINRDKIGIRVKSLRNSGFNTVADIAAATVHEIAAINGISEEGATVIRRIVEQIIDITRKDTKIRISADKKTRNSNRLITAICAYQKLIPIAEECSKIREENSRLVGYALEDLSSAAGTLKWFFSSADKKQTAQQAYQFLSGLLNTSYYTKSISLLNSLDSIVHMDPAKAWGEFEAHSVSFINTLENIAPNVLGTDDSVYGLPQELAREIQDEAYFPDGLLVELRRYQEWGVRYILHQGRVLLGDEMGLGKTIQAIAAMVSLKNTGATHFLVVCPASVISNWCREVSTKSKLRVTKIYGDTRDAAMASWLECGGVAVTTYETTQHLELPKGFRLSMMVVDEAHYIKNPQAQRTINTKRLSEHADRLLLMTGTALENRVDEMVSLIGILQPDIAQRISGIETLSFAPVFRQLIAPVYYRRKREDVLTELPQKIESEEWCELLPEEQTIYEWAVLERRYADARQVSWNVKDLANSSKANRLLEIVEDAEDEGRKVIVFSFFLNTVEKVANLLADRCVGPITGSVSPQRRQEIVDEFDEAPSGTVLVAQIQSGGVGLNIQSASVVILCEPQFKPSTENQAISRAYRMGQTRNVLVYRLLCEDTVDEKIVSLLKSKQKIFNAFADESVAAEESVELDEKGFGEIINEEIQRINAKNSRTF